MITPKTVLQFLFGKRDAIEKIAGTNSSLWLAFLFIASAGLARNYDHHLLLQEPLWIGGPVFMSLFSSLLIFVFIKLFGRLTNRVFSGQNYLAFLRCFVMTAPLAWLYGIPVENHMDLLPATVFNFSVLLLVSIWRVALMIRVIQVLFHFSLPKAFALIAIPASAEMFFATFVKAINIVGIMGGMRLSEANRFLLDATSVMTFGSGILFVIACLTGIISKRVEARSFSPSGQAPRVAWTSWILAVLVLSAWLFVAIAPQQKLANQSTFRKLIRQSDYEAATQFLEGKSRADFPPHQFLVQRGTRWGSPPNSMGLLVYHDDWPDWLREEVLEDLNRWIAREKEERSVEEIHESLYRNYDKAPFVQNLADSLTPGVMASDYFPALKDDHSE